MIPPPRPVPAFSVVIRAHNSRWRIDRAIASVLKQSAGDWELIVVDDGSTDGTSDWIRSAYAGERRMRLIAGMSRRGAAAAANIGVERARGARIGFLDSDDEWTPAFLATLGQALDDNTEAIAAYADHIQVWDEVALERVVGAPDPEDQRGAMLAAPFIPCLSQMLFRRAELLQLGRFDERFAVVSDRDVLYRAVLRHPRPFVAVALPLARRHFHAGNLMNDSERAVREGRAAVERAFAHPAAAPHLRLKDQAMAGVAARAAGFERQRATLAGTPTAPISVVIATRDRRALLQEAIASVDRQAYRNRELIVVDDGSTDGTGDWLRSLGRDDLRVLTVAAGCMAAARNHGNAAASGEIIAALDDDDRWLDGYLAAVAGAFSLSPAPVFSFADFFIWQTVGGGVRRVFHQSPADFPDLVQRMLDTTFPISTTVFAARREVLTAVGGYDPSFRRGEDLDLYLRLLTHQFRAGIEAQASHAPAHIALPLATRLIAPLDRDANALRDLSVHEHDRVLDKFFASPAGAAYRELAESARAVGRARLSRFYRDAMGVDAASEPANSMPTSSEDMP